MPAPKKSEVDDDNLAHFLTRLSWKGRLYFASLLLLAVTAGINLARIGIVREFWQISVEPRVEVREIKVAAASQRNPEIDRKIQEWTEENEKRLRDLHLQLARVEEEARFWAGYEDKEKSYAALALRLKDSIAKENEAFGRNLAALQQTAR